MKIDEVKIAFEGSSLFEKETTSVRTRGMQIPRVTTFPFASRNPSISIGEPSRLQFRRWNVQNKYLSERKEIETIHRR